MFELEPRRDSTRLVENLGGPMSVESEVLPPLHQDAPSTKSLVDVQRADVGSLLFPIGGRAGY